MVGGLRKLAMCLAILFVQATESAHAVDDAAIVAKRPPALLSEFGFFASLRDQLPAEGVIPFDVATPLFSDHATKLRFVYVPPGLVAQYESREAFRFPVGTALTKTFAMPGDLRRPDRDLRMIETRVLLRKEDGWDAWAYLWNDEQSDAERLVPGKKVPVKTVDMDGKPLAFTYSVPNKNQCKGCHAFNGEVTPIGPKARNLNRLFDYGDGAENQLDRWIAAGILAGAPEAADWPSVPVWHDNSGSVAERARAWLDNNCAHCHRPEGPASNTGLFLTWHEENPVALGINKRPVAAGRGSLGLEFDIAPGDPERSILLKRVESREPGIMMPELGRSLTDVEAVELLAEWIGSIR